MKPPRPCEKCEELATARWELYLAHQNEHFEQERKRDARVALIVGAVLFAAIVILFATGCTAHRVPDSRPTPPATIEAHLDVFPQITIAGHDVMLVAWLSDPEAVVSCPTLTWIWEDGTRSSHTADCDPAERATRHQVIKYVRAYPGDHPVVVEFAAAGRTWRAQGVVKVAGA